VLVIYIGMSFDQKWVGLHFSPSSSGRPGYDKPSDVLKGSVFGKGLVHRNHLYIHLVHINHMYMHLEVE
jgi:hypothetical protein